MSNLFSHAHEPDYVLAQETKDVEVSVILGVPTDQAFDGFTDGVHLWWPVAEQSIFGEGSHVAVLRDHLVEEADDGEEVVWAEVVEWDAGEFLRLHWVLGHEQNGSADIDVHFEVVGDSQTRVRVITEPITQGTEQVGKTFICDWSLILARYTRFMGGALRLD